MFGTPFTTGAPPRIDWCGRRYYPGGSTETLAAVQSFLARNGRSGINRVASTPSGLPIVANVMPVDERASYNTNICTMSLWVQTGRDSYLGYGLSGGP
jgi:hypothetical protein